MKTRQNCLIWQNIIEPEEAELFLLGIPFDSTVTGTPGTRKAPTAIRHQVNDLSSFDPDNGSFQEVKLFDAGNVETIPGNPKKTWKNIEETVKELVEINPEAKFLFLGGEHSITFPIARALNEEKSFDYLCFDGHWDLLNNWKGVKESHAAVNQRVSELLGKEKMEVKGVVDGSKEEWRKSQELGKAKDPVYLSVDVDVLKNVPCSTPVAAELELPELWNEIKNRELVAADVCEYNPLAGKSALPADLVKKLILKLGKN